MKRFAFTLLEVIIVLSIMVSLLAISWPRMRNVAARTALREAALHVKAGLAEARDLAVRSRAETRFSFQSNGSEFHIAEAESALVDQENLINLDVSEDDLTLNQDGSEESDPIDSTSRELPDPVKFVSLENAESEQGSDPEGRNDPPVASNFLGLSPAVSDDDSKIQEMAEYSINFFPDGRGSSATIRLASADTNESVTLTVRALTGGVTIGQIEQEHVAEDEQLNQDQQVIKGADQFSFPPTINQAER